MTRDLRLIRQQLIDDARVPSLDGGGMQTVKLDALVALMKERSREAGNEGLSSLYFAGAFDDHPYFLHNRAVAVGLAVLPEDRAKAARRKAHPRQKEIIIVLQGRLLVEIEGEPAEMKSGDVTVIEPGTCHSVRPIGNEHAAYLFIKTLPAEEPRELDCP